MLGSRAKHKLREWLRHYVVAELLGTVTALAAAWTTYAHTHSFLAAAGAGFVGEGVGFYGYFISTELLRHGLRTKGMSFYERIAMIVTSSGTNLLVEFAPAELLDNLFVRPFAIFLIPQFIKPYALGFLAAKFAADLLFYTLAVAGYEAKKRWLASR